MSPTEFQAFRKGQTVTDFIHSALHAGYKEEDFSLTAKEVVQDNGMLSHLVMEFHFLNEDFVKRFVPGAANVGLDRASADEVRAYFDEIIMNFNR